MHIAARMALCAAGTVPGMGYHGCDVVIRELSPSGFVADSRVKVPSGELVRLKLPGAGAMLARVEAIEGERLSASFLNPISSSRLGMTVGMGAAVQAAA